MTVSWFGKDGGLIYVSLPVFKVVTECEKSIRINNVNTNNQITVKSNLIQRLINGVLRSCEWNRYFNLSRHISPGFEDDHHVSQIAKRSYCQQVFYYAYPYIWQIVHKEHCQATKSQCVIYKLSKLILFKNLWCLLLWRSSKDI